jgi:small-conductance mechanosensitive channel
MTSPEHPRGRWRHRQAEDLLQARDSLLAAEARIRPDFKRAVAAALVALVSLVAGEDFGDVHQAGHKRYISYGLAVVFAVTGAIAVRSAAREVQKIVAPRAGLPASAALKLLCSAVGYVLVFFGVLGMLSVNTRSLLVGGAVTGVVIGIAAQQSLGNFFAGLVLLVARPYVPGQRIVVRSGGLGGPFEGTVTATGLVYTTLLTPDGPINIPNSGLLAAAIGPAPEPRPSAPDPLDPAEPVLLHPDPAPVVIKRRRLRRQPRADK